MDWSRAKTILIVTFVVLNIFLAAQINSTIEEKSLFVQTGNITDQQLQKFLKDNHVKMTVKPENITELNPFVAQISPLPSDWIQDEKGSYTKSYSKPLSVENEHELRKVLAKEVPFFHSYRQSAISSQKTTYLQYENGMPIFDGKLNVYFTKDKKISSIQLLHYQTKIIKKIDLISFNNALYNLLYSDELSRFSKPTITNALLGYNARSNPNQTDDYYLMPYWRFTVNNNQFVDVNALSGNIEQPGDS